MKCNWNYSKKYTFNRLFGIDMDKILRNERLIRQLEKKGMKSIHHFDNK